LALQFCELIVMLNTLQYPISVGERVQAAEARSQREKGKGGSAMMDEDELEQIRLVLTLESIQVCVEY